MTKKTTLLIDSDIVAFKFASTAQETYDWGDGVKSVHVGDFEPVKAQIDDYLADLLVRLKATDLLICLSVPSSEGFRKGILPSYKDNRANVARPVLLQPAKDYMAEKYPSYIRPTLEADDVMGILSTHPNLIPGKKIIVSEDKDMLTIPGWLFNPRKDRKPHMVPEHDADYWHLFQALTGDTTDNYKGCPGVGPVKARNALITENLRHLPVADMWASVVALYESKGLTEDDALLQARVARICRHTDWDFQNKQVRLWTPPQK